MGGTKNTQERGKKDLRKDHKNKTLKGIMSVPVVLQNCLNFWIQKQLGAPSLIVPLVTKKILGIHQLIR